MAKGRRKSTPTDKAVANRKQAAKQEFRLSPELRAWGQKMLVLDAKIRERQAAAPKYDPEITRRLDTYIADPHGIRALVRELKPEKPRKLRQARQVERVLRVLPEVYPNGVSNEIATATVQGKVAEHLELETKKLGLSDPSWDSVNRALGRDLK